MLESKSAQLQRLAQSYAQETNCPGCGEVAPLRFSCLESGFPSHCSADCYAEDRIHTQYVDDLRTIHLDLMDLHSGRKFPEFDMPQAKSLGDELQSAISGGWDTYLKSREFNLKFHTSGRHVSHLLTYPLSVAYGLLKVQPELASTEGPLKLIFVGSRAETRLPAKAWRELACLFKFGQLELEMVGHEVLEEQNGVYESLGAGVSRRSHVGSVDFEADYMTEPAPACYALFNSGVGFAGSRDDDCWHETLQQLLSTGAPIVFTSHSADDAARDQKELQQLMEKWNVQHEWMLEAQINPFRSLRKDPARNNVRHMIQTNHTIFILRGVL